MRSVELRARELADTDQATVPACLYEVLEEESDGAFDGVDKAATPAERVGNESEFTREMDRSRPQILVNQRDSDARKEVEASRMGALSTVSELEVRRGSALIDQFVTWCIP